MELNYKYAESTVQPTALEVTVGTAVSYTHLDVYKRQITARSITRLSAATGTMA